ncbi:tRNA glutamyl-Q(34) synthetase GluQRS [Sphingomonas oligophenolica]|uniref:tRNA glutamyl-Q(34) synthetase GluQRS n=2 Tax=Sphingomonas oligophenolica TaxID=301154 RepID=A0ABU9Y9F4_9SPHN
MPVTSRFAPSPTGRLHLGHAWSAIQAHDRAQGSGGRFLLRIEDIDGTRSRPEFVAGILEDLAWLGLDWEQPVVFQSARSDLYAAAIERLRGAGLLYPCFCTRAEIAASLAAPHGDGDPVYPGNCRHLASGERQRRMTGERYAWRLDMARAIASLAAKDSLVWHDELAGSVIATPEIHGDVILARKDAPASYHLAVTIDDAAQGVSHVVRGRDLFAATHVHRLLQALLGLPTPVYRHHALLTDGEGERLAKRNGAPTLAAMRAAGIDGRKLADDLRNGRLPIGFRLAGD